MEFATTIPSEVVSKTSQRTREYSRYLEGIFMSCESFVRRGAIQSPRENPELWNVGGNHGIGSDGLRTISSAGRCAFFDLRPGIAKADGPIEDHLIPRVAVNTIIAKTLKLILSARFCVAHTRFYFAVGQYLQ